MFLNIYLLKKAVAFLVFFLAFLSMGIVSEEEYKNTVITPGDKLIIEFFKE